jgi:hypothetical protein
MATHSVGPWRGRLKAEGRKEVRCDVSPVSVSVFVRSAFRRQNLPPCCRLPYQTIASHPNHPINANVLPPPHYGQSTCNPVDRDHSSCRHLAYRIPHPVSLTPSSIQNTGRPIGSPARHNTKLCSPTTPCPPCLLSRNSARWPLSAADLSVRSSHSHTYLQPASF